MHWKTISRTQVHLKNKKATKNGGIRSTTHVQGQRSKVKVTA